MKIKSSLSVLLCLSFITLGLSFNSCKKDKGTPDQPSKPTSLSDADSLKYLMYRIMQVTFVDDGRDTTTFFPTYYWYNQVPGLDPLSTSYDSADVLLAKMKTYAINPNTGRPYDKYSFLDHGEVADEIQHGIAGDLGMQVTYARDNNNNTFLYVLFADKNSPAGLVGVTRGWEITAINGNTSVSYDGSNGPNVQRVINAVYNDPSSSFTFKDLNGNSVTKTLTKAVYNINPVLFDSVYSVGSKKVGYFVFNTFSAVSDDNGGSTVTRQELNRVFSKFQNANISSLIVDLRYNGGGSVGTAQYIDSLIAPSSVAGKEMYHYLYNDKLTAIQTQAGLPDKVMYSGGGGLNLQNVFFIGSGNTASASELTINNLKPYMTVKLVGDTTYGKPVGFFTFHITDFPNGGAEKDLADLYAINFETRNANNQGGYFDGLVPDQLATDFVNIPWGNPSDDHLKKIFNYIAVGTFTRESASQRMAANPALRLVLPHSAPALRFNGMVDYKVSKKLAPLVSQNLGRR